MTKLPADNKFIDLSDYGRGVARGIAQSLKHTNWTPIHVTLSFIGAGMLAITFIYFEYYWLAALFLVLKSILDAADGELARIRQTPSYVGRYFDSIADIVLNALIFSTLWYLTDANIGMTVLAFFGMQLQGTLYNYYYVILRNSVQGDATSRVFEKEVPVAMPGESQKNVTFFFRLYILLYGVFDKIIYLLDPKAAKVKHFPKWFMTLLSTFGLGFQLALIGIFLLAGWKEYIIPFFLYYSAMVGVFIIIRKGFIRS